MGAVGGAVAVAVGGTSARLVHVDRRKVIAVTQPKPPRTENRPYASWRDNFILVLLGTWTIIGIYLDVWSHKNRGDPESFFSGWHALFYAGFAATAAWLVWLVLRDGGRERSLRAVPVGYGLGLVGLVLFAGGGLADFVWHSLFGIESQLDAFTSPPHLMIGLGFVLMITSPLRSEWSSSESEAAPGFATFFPVLASVALTVAAVSLFLHPLSPVLGREPTDAFERALDRFTEPFAYHATTQIIGLASVIVTNLIFVGAVLFLLRRWHTPFGSIGVLFGSVAAIVGFLEEFPLGLEVVGSALASGLIVDALIHFFGPSARRPSFFWATAAVIPLVLWSAHFLVVGAVEGMGWTIELWFGAIVLASLTGFGLGLLVMPPRPPALVRSDRTDDVTLAPGSTEAPDEELAPGRRPAF